MESDLRIQRIGLSPLELQAEIDMIMARLDALQEDEEHFGGYADLMRMTALAALNRAADLIDRNNQRIAEQLTAAGVRLGADAGEK